MQKEKDNNVHTEVVVQTKICSRNPCFCHLFLKFLVYTHSLANESAQPSALRSRFTSCA